MLVDLHLMRPAQSAFIAFILSTSGCASQTPHVATPLTPPPQAVATQPARLAPSPPAPQETLTAAKILQRADEVRNPQIDYTMTVTVTSVKPESAPRVATYEVLVKGRDKTLIRTLSPPVDKGRLLLMNERNLWAFLPTVSKPLRVSLRERLIGEVANGDLARVNFTGDYTPTLLRTEPVDNHPAYVLELRATAEDVTYGRVILWVATETFHPLRAEFYAVSGRQLKTCTYGQYRMLAGILRPSELTMTDAIHLSQRSTITYDAMSVTPLPEKYFTKDYMKKFME